MLADPREPRPRLLTENQPEPASRRELPQNEVMTRMHPSLLALLMLIASLLLLALPGWQNWRLQQAPDFHLYPAGPERKEAFFNYLGPMIDTENGRWLEERQKLLRLMSVSPSKRERLWVEQLGSFFDLPASLSPADRIGALLVHVDEIPRSLALAQAAKESAWGTSRFAIEGYNYFGQRCYAKGCGLVPEARPTGAKFEVRRFSSPLASVASYMSNINSHPEYAGLREYRAAVRLAGRPVSGILAAEEMIQYSERRQDYVDEIQSLIHFNRLEASGDDGAAVSDR